jgi:outer membrane protein OmpA-like peptidoglycan-associated protein
VADHAVLAAGRDAAPCGPGDGHEDDLESLRSILIGPAEHQIQALQARMDDRFAQARDVGAVLPEALLLRANDSDLARALTPPVERAITASVRRDPQPLADALFPVIGPAIRKAVAASLASMVESLNTTLDHSVSWRALQWRVESFRTGKPFGEVVLLHTLLYRVEQVFLIHRSTGLLLQHVRSGTHAVEDAQMVSAMLTAIRDFAQDSFRVSAHESLDALQVGDLSVWIEQGPHAILAIVIRGAAPPSHREVLQRTLEAVHLRFGESLESFGGDAQAFDPARPLLEECLHAEYRSDSAPRGRVTWLLVALGLIALCTWAALWWRDRSRWESYLEALKREPGLVVISAGRSGGRFLVDGLRDPLARDPSALLSQASLAPEDVAGTWQPYQALAPDFVLARARQALRPPPGATLTLEGGVLAVAGDAPLGWIVEARRTAPLIAGVSAFDGSAALASRRQRVAVRIEAAALRFEKGTSRLLGGQDDAIRAIAGDARELGALAAAAGEPVRLEIVGHTDADGAPDANLPLSRARAEQVALALGLASATGLDVGTVGVGSREPLTVGDDEIDKQRNRRVSFRVSKAPAAGPEGAPR